ncbi:probable calcium-binding protein CML25 [Actinia tenebrosa]|uniref:Probable calcium-binding protein CML25 n=1 Tax=Actinia tenebrosa TaxID=6105 RepID=A0A6P8IHG2_ACTTE|nr:probable calcium-binding protein CML25 [Actinia tenebrosa]
MQAGNSFFNFNAPIIVLKSLFQKYDKNGSGFLEEKEIRCLLESDLGLNASQSEIYTLLLDKNGDHSVSFEDFVNWLRSEERFQNIDNSSRYAILSQALDYFKSFDVDDNDSLSLDEFKKEAQGNKMHPTWKEVTRDAYASATNTFNRVC